MTNKSGVSIRVVFNRVPQMAADIATQGAAHVERTADRVAVEAQSRAPYDTGYLHDNIKRTGSGLSCRVESAAPYSGYQEYGTSTQAAHPFFWPAVEQERSGYLAGWRAILSGTGQRSASTTVLAGRATIRRRTGGRLPR